MQQKFWVVFAVCAISACSPVQGRSGDSDANTGGFTSGAVTGGGTGGFTTTDSTDGADGSDSSDNSDGAGTAGASECTPGLKSCSGNSKLQCQLTGKWSLPEPCPAGTVCSKGICGGCAPEQLLCQGNTLIKCGDKSTYEVVKTCNAGEFCFNEVCVPCVPGSKECRLSAEGVNETWQCEQVGENVEWVKTAVCPEDCKNGLCINPCQSDIKLNTNQGCDYYAIDLQNSDEVGMLGTSTPANAQFAVIVTNPSSDKPMTVTVHETQKAVPMVEKLVQPKGLEIIPLGPRNVMGSVQGNLAWRVKADRPFVAYQFNPLDNVNPVFSNDASLLLPVNALGKEYVVMTGAGGGAFVTVIGTKSETEVTVSVTHDTEIGQSVPALKAGESITRTLGASEVLNIKATEAVGIKDDLTGSRVIANKNVVVFGGNKATTTGDRCCADHLEQQLFPVSSWGTVFVASKSKPRWDENDHWRILAAEDGTNITFSGGVANPITLNAGKFYDLQNQADFVITADKPIMVGQFLASSGEILPKGVFCNSNSECQSGVCSGAGTGMGRCADLCQGTQSSCSANEYCLDNVLFGATAPLGGSCVTWGCGAGLPACPGGSTCIDPGNGNSQCFANCIGTMCSNPLQDCIQGTQYGNICDLKQCAGDFNCPGGWCMIPAGQVSGTCVRSCNVVPSCPQPKQVCLPGGLASDPNQKQGLCLTAGCKTTADCEAGHACVEIDGQPEGSCQPIGDPAFILAVPTEQFRDEYKFLAPNAYEQDFINILAPKSAFVQLDGVDVGPEQFELLPGTNFMVARVSVSDGSHTIKATEPVGVVVYGYHDDVSYGYPAGANLFDLGK